MKEVGTEAMDNERIDQIIDKHQSEAASLIQLLLDIQHENGWLSREILERVSEKLQVPFARVQQTATFYKAFRIVPKGEHVIHVCNGTACHARGAQKVVDAMQDQTGIKPGETDLDSKFSLVTCNCLGRCALGPVVEIDGKTHDKMSPEKTKDMLKKYE